MVKITYYCNTLAGIAASAFDFVLMFSWSFDDLGFRGAS